MEQGILPSFVTSDKSLNLSDPPYNWEGDLHDLSIQVLTSYYIRLAKAFHGTGFDFFGIVTLAVAHCPYGTPSCEGPLSLIRRKQPGPPAWELGWWRLRAPVSQIQWAGSE